MGRLARVLIVAFAALFGLCAGCAAGFLTNSPHRKPNVRAESKPLPHHVPQHADGVALRFAMVHDVLHERFSKHGRAYYQERNRLTRQRLAPLKPDNTATFPMADDLAAEFERLGQPDEAVAVMRDKLARQKARGLPDENLYTSYANLGTFLTIANFWKAAAGDAAARDRFREGGELVQKSIAVNSKAHFGREKWQAAVADFQLAAMHDPNVLRTFDCLGNRLDLGTKEILVYESSHPLYGRAAFTRSRSSSAAYEVPDFFKPDVQPGDPAQWEKLKPIREHITRVGAEQGWDATKVRTHKAPVPFDEPVLGIIGMWRQGGGANPHFALALGETMLRVGQRHIAWSAFERAARLADQFWPDPALREFLRAHCRQRQEAIERTLLTARPDDGSVLSPEEVAKFRPRFEAELAYGEGYQRAYQEYEEKQIAAGKPIADEHFYDAFNAGREPIASPVGPEERFAWAPHQDTFIYTLQRAWAWGAFGAGLSALLVAALLRRVRGRSPSQKPDREVTEKDGELGHAEKERQGE